MTPMAVLGSQFGFNLQSGSSSYQHYIQGKEHFHVTSNSFLKFNVYHRKLASLVVFYMAPTSTNLYHFDTLFTFKLKLVIFFKGIPLIKLKSPKLFKEVKVR